MQGSAQSTTHLPTNIAQIIAIALTGDGGLVVYLDGPHRCPFCSVPRWLYVNRDGVTRCWSCDDERQRRVRP